MTISSDVTTKSRINPFFAIMRPNQWIKNCFVYTGFLFGGDIYNFELFLRVSLIAIGFCLISSSMYIVNDIIDYENDLNHPIKKNRPIASGRLNKNQALTIADDRVGLS